MRIGIDIRTMAWALLALSTLTDSFESELNILEEVGGAESSLQRVTRSTHYLAVAAYIG